MSVATAPAASPRIECPCCGYDQRGAISSWRELCPLNGTCAECGLEFEWRELLNETKRTIPRWCVESRQPLWRWPAQVVFTLARAWWPRLIWRRIEMFHQPAAHRQAAYVLTLLLILFAAFMVCNGLAAVVYWKSMATSSAPFTFTASTGPWPVFVQAVFKPWARRSIGTSTITPVPPAAPIAGTSQGGTLVVTPLPPMPYPLPRQFIPWLVRQWPQFLALLAFPVFTGLAFAALPQSRRRAKVRWTHIWRAMIYAYGIVVPVVVFSLLSIPLHRQMLPSPAAGATVMHRMGWLTATLLGLLMPVLLASLPFIALAYWWTCARWHLRMSQAWVVSLSVLVIGALASAGLAFWLGEWARFR